MSVRVTSSSVFTISDYYHPGRGIGCYGLLRADPDRNIIAVKRAYGAVRNIVTVFDSSITRVPRRVSSPETSLQLWEFARKGQPLFVFWTTGEFSQSKDGWKMRYERPKDGYAIHPILIEHPGEPMKDPVWIDLLSGKIWEFPKANVLKRAGGTTYTNVPSYDSPCILTERTALDINPSSF